MMDDADILPHFDISPTQEAFLGFGPVFGVGKGSVTALTKNVKMPVKANDMLYARQVRTG